MIIKKRIKNETVDTEYNKYEFDLFFIDTIDEKKSNENTYIFIEQKSDIENAYNAINYVNKYPGLITTSLADLYSVFNKSGVWKYSYFEGNNLEDLKKQLLNIKSNNIFLSIYCNQNHSLSDYYDIIDELNNQCKNSFIKFGLPYLDNETKKIILHIFYQ